MAQVTINEGLTGRKSLKRHEELIALRNETPTLIEDLTLPPPQLQDRDTLDDAMATDLIVSDPEILGGKPCVRGTRLSVEFLLELAASGATQADILARYPQLTKEGLAAAFQYAANALKGERTWEIKTTA